MRFQLEHTFDASVDVVEKASNAPDYQASLNDLPNLGKRTVTSLEENPDGSMHRVTRYTLGAQLPGPVVAVLGRSATWDEIADYDPTTRTWTFTIEPHVMAGRLDCSGSYTFEPVSDDSAKRVVDVEVKVKAPIVGGRVEKEIRKGLVETLEAEAKLLREYLSR